MAPATKCVGRVFPAKGLLDDDARSDADAAVEILDVLVEHPDATVRNEMADRAWLVAVFLPVLSRLSFDRLLRSLSNTASSQIAPLAMLP
jgi:hypothetical protein